MGELAAQLRQGGGGADEPPQRPASGGVGRTGKPPPGSSDGGIATLYLPAAEGGDAAAVPQLQVWRGSCARVARARRGVDETTAQPAFTHPTPPTKTRYKNVPHKRPVSYTHLRAHETLMNL
eukprot:3596867-Prymnesium_polylepis.1